MIKQNSHFSLSSDNMIHVKAIMGRYPKKNKASALLPLLDLAQRQNGGWLSAAIVEYLSEMLEIQAIRIYEVVSFYTMFNLKPVGKYHVQVCRTTPCWLRGSENILNACKKTLHINSGETTEDGKFSLTEVECLGACVNAPVVQINDDYYENLTPESCTKIIKELAKK